MTKHLSIVMPVYKNAPTLSELYLRLTHVLETVTDSYELLFVDDACPDGSSLVLRELAARDSRVAVLLLASNIGQNRAVMAGLHHAQGALLVVMDADLQDPPEAIPDLLWALVEDTAAVFAGRRGQYENWMRLVSSKLFKHMLHLLSGRRVPADAGLFVAMRRHTRDRLLEFNVAQPYVVGLLGRTRLPLRSIPVTRHANNERDSAYTTRKRLLLACRAVYQLLPQPVLADALSSRRPVVVNEYIGARFSVNEAEQDMVPCVSW